MSARVDMIQGAFIKMPWKDMNFVPEDKIGARKAFPFGFALHPGPNESNTR